MAEKNVSVLSNLLEVRRLLRFIKLNTDKNKKQVKSMTRYISTSKINTVSDKIRAKYCTELASLLKQITSNLKLLNHVKVSLNTHLLEHTNLHKKLHAQTEDMLEENLELKKTGENAVSNMSTKFKSTLQVVVSDLAKRFKTKKQMIISDGEDSWGVITIDLKESLFCVITIKENLFYLKTYINELPAEINDNNNIEFKSPAQAFTIISKIIQEDGL